MHTTTLAEVLVIVDHAPPVCLPEDANALLVFRALSCGPHSLVLVDEISGLTRFITQTDCVRFACTQLITSPELRAYFSLSGRRLNVLKPINSILATMHIRDAVWRLDRLGGALPVVSANGVLQVSTGFLSSPSSKSRSSARFFTCCGSNRSPPAPSVACCR
jgi:hypothetical protein